ncbi:MAG TPA: methyltransferase domain-containing protein [Acidimicrobiia bacterium]|jgi:SAM-dependent methyltransferase
MAVHEVAAAGFGKEAAAYQRSRPTYPPEVVQWIVDGLGLAPGARCVDLAAGTGILTALLRASKCSLVALEPIEGMRNELRAAVPDVPCASGLAEALPIASGSLDGVTIAQAFHWFDAERALAELRRALRIGGHVALVWNARERSEDWVDKVWGVMDRVEKHAPWRNHDHVATTDSQERREQSLTGAPGFGEVRTAQFHHTQAMTPALVVERIKGVSHVAALEGAEQEAVLDEVRQILATHPDTVGRTELALPYRVDCYMLERVD